MDKKELVSFAYSPLSPKPIFEPGSPAISLDKFKFGLVNNRSHPIGRMTFFMAAL